MLPRIKNDTRQIMVSVMLPNPRKQQQELANPPNEKQGYKQEGVLFRSCTEQVFKAPSDRALRFAQSVRQLTCVCCVCVCIVCDEKRCWLICVNKANAVMVQCQQPDDEKTTTTENQQKQN